MARSLVAVGLAAATLTTSACAGDSITAPVAATEHAAPSHGLIGTLTGTVGGVLSGTLNTLNLVTGLQWSRPVTQETATKVIGPSGGSFSIPGGIKVTVPKGAVSSNTTFSVTRLPGNIVAYDFQPHGTKFAVPLVIEHSTKQFNLLQLLLARNVRAAYFPNPSLLNQGAGTAVVSEFRPTSLTLDKSTVKFTVDHFSGYMVSMD